MPPSKMLIYRYLRNLLTLSFVKELVVNMVELDLDLEKMKALVFLVFGVILFDWNHLLTLLRNLVV